MEKEVVVTSGFEQESPASDLCDVMEEEVVSSGFEPASDQESEKERNDSPRRKRVSTRKYQGSAKYSTGYQKTWEEKFDFISKSRLEGYFYCKICNKDVSIKHQGSLDIQRHSEGEMHKNRALALRSQAHLSFKKKNDPIHMKVAAAEVRNTVMIAHHNVALSLSDHLGPMQRKNFPDSEIAKNYHCARTKTACILNYALGPYLQQELVSAMRSEPYSLSVDASNDTGLSKMNPLTVRIFDINRKTVSQKFLDLCLTTGADASKSSEVFDKINETLIKHNVSWDNCTAFGVDNTNSNIGAKNSLKSRVTQVNPSIYFVGCPCHIIHNAAQKAAEAYTDLSGIDIEECCIDHFYWFDKSTKRKGYLSEYAAFCDTEYRSFIKHINVRWLSLEKAIGRILQMFEASCSYFKSESMSEARFQRLLKLYENPMLEVHLLFFQAALPTFTTFNLFLQRDAPQIYLLHDQMQNLLIKLLSKFVKANAIKEYRESGIMMDYSDVINQLEDSKLFVGLLTSSTLRKKLHDGDITDRCVKKFYASVRSFYETAVAYALKWFPFHENLVRDSKFVDFRTKDQCDFSMVCTFLERYPSIFKFNSQELDKLNEEFVDYQALSNEDIPQDVWDMAVCYEVNNNSEKISYHRMDLIWSHLAEMKLPGMSINRFSKLSKVAKVVLTIPHSNAGEERVFSTIRKIKREDRGSLQLEGSLSSLVTVKLNLPETNTMPCFSFQPPESLLHQAKQATSFYNKEVCSSSK